MNIINILISGSNGFIGKYLQKYFQNIKYNVYTLDKVGIPSSRHLRIDILDKYLKLPDIKLDIIIHAAGKAHILPKTKAEKDLFYKVNAEGTQNLINAINKLAFKPKSFILISTVAVYGIETGSLIDENYPLTPKTPYGISKKLAEQIILNWKNNETLKTIIRLPLVIGKDPPGNLGRMISSIKKGIYFNIGNGETRRSMVLGEDIARFIPILAKKQGIFNLTDGYHPSYSELSNVISKMFDKKIRNIPYPIAKIMAKSGDFIEKFTTKSMQFNSSILEKLTNDLTFSDEKARKELGWNPRKVLNEIPNVI